MLTGDNGILTRAGEAKEKVSISSAKEEIQLAIMASYDSLGRINTGTLEKELNSIGAKVLSKGENNWYIEHKGYKFKIDLINSKLEELTDMELAMLGEGNEIIEADPDEWNVNGDTVIQYLGNKTNIVIPTYFKGTKITNIGCGIIYSKNIKNVKIPEGITSIEEGAFAGTNIEGTLTLPNSIITIGENAFYKCKKLTGDLIIPHNVNFIGEQAFGECTGFNGNLVIGNNVKQIGKRAFYGCSELTGDLIIPDSVTDIESEAFKDCSKLTGKLYIGEDIVRCVGATDSSIPNNAFKNVEIATKNIPNSLLFSCSNITGTLTFKNTVETIGANAFQGCIGLTGNLIIPDSVKEIGMAAFQGCKGLSGSLILGKKLSIIGDAAFINCNNLTGDLIIPENVISIGSGAFCRCTGLNGSLTIGNAVKNIGSEAFSGCNGFNGNLIIPDNVITLGNSAFQECTGFNGKLYLGKNIETIGTNTFLALGISSTGFTNVEINMKNIPDNLFTSGPGINIKGILTLGNNVETIGNGVFSGRAITGTVDIPNNVTSIGSRAFACCTNIDVINIPTSVTTIGENAFQNISKDKIKYSGTAEGLPWGAI